MAGNDDYTVSLLHCNGADESTTFTDVGVGGSAHTWTAQGGAQLDTAQKKFGTASGQFLTATDDYISTPDSDDWYFAGDPFTIDCWVRFDDPITFWNGYLQYVDINNWILWYYHNASQILNLLMKVGGVQKAYYIAAWVPSVTTWYHLALERNGATVEEYIDGVAQTPTEVTAIGAEPVPNFAGLATWGLQDTGLKPFNGHMDEMRISKGIARYQGNFTPETSEYTIEVEGSGFFVIL